MSLIDTPTVTAPHGSTPTLDPGLTSDAACTLVELSSVPTDATLLRRAAQQLPQVTEQVRQLTGTANTSDDAGWLDVWRPCGIVAERT